MKVEAWQQQECSRARSRHLIAMSAQLLACPVANVPLCPTCTDLSSQYISTANILPSACNYDCSRLLPDGHQPCGWKLQKFTKYTLLQTCLIYHGTMLQEGFSCWPCSRHAGSRSSEAAGQPCRRRHSAQPEALAGCPALVH